MLYFITGASGSGKTACIETLREMLPDSKVFDFDEIGVPENPDKVWRQQSTETWLKKYLTEGLDVKSFCICGQVVLGEILACPSAKLVENVNLCLLDVSDLERIRRLTSRNTYGVNQDMLNWAAWLRVHHHDPRWDQQVIKDNAWLDLDFSRWDTSNTWGSLATTKIIDTSALTISQVSEAIKSWIEVDEPVCEGKVIFLNGPSSSGKSTLAKRLQEQLPEAYLHIGIDKLIGMMPAHLNDWEGGLAEEGFFWKKAYDSDGREVCHIQMGPYARKVNNALKKIVLTMLNEGLNVIVDDVCINNESLEIWKNTLLPYKVLYVGVRAPVEILEAREKERGNRMPGSARAQHELVHRGNQYDLAIDTSSKSIEACVKTIMRGVKSQFSI